MKDKISRLNVRTDTAVNNFEEKETSENKRLQNLVGFFFRKISYGNNYLMHLMYLFIEFNFSDIMQ